MKLTCKTNNLKDAIAKVERIVSKQTTLPILGNILISTENGRLLIASTNLEIAIKVYVGAKIDEEGDITVPSRIISGFLSTIKDELVSGAVSGTELEMNSSSHRLKIKGMDAKDFPIIPEMPESHFFKVKTASLAEASNGVLISVAHNDSRQELNGVFVKLDREMLIMASTDSFRLSESRIKIEEGSISEEYLKYIETNASIIIPSLTLSEIQRIMDGEFASLAIHQNQLFIQTKDVKIISRLINGNYPEYQQVLPKKYEITVKVEKDKLLNALKIASLVANSQNGEVQVKNEANNALVVVAESMDTGENLSKVPAQIDGPDFEVFFNCRYLIEGLGSALFRDKEVEICLNQQKSPVMIKSFSAGEVEFVYVIMPIIKG